MRQKSNKSIISNHSNKRTKQASKQALFFLHLLSLHGYCYYLLLLLCSVVASHLHHRLPRTAPPAPSPTANNRHHHSAPLLLLLPLHLLLLTHFRLSLLAAAAGYHLQHAPAPAATKNPSLVVDNH